MTRYDDTHHPLNGVLPPHARSAALRWFVGSLVMFFMLVGVALVFWNAANPRSSVEEERENVVSIPGYFSTEGGHDPIRRPRNTRDELKFRGALTPPPEVPQR